MLPPKLKEAWTLSAALLVMEGTKSIACPGEELSLGHCCHKHFNGVADLKPLEFIYQPPGKYIPYHGVQNIGHLSLVQLTFGCVESPGHFGLHHEQRVNILPETR